jgi:hypothetical protein
MGTGIQDPTELMGDAIRKLGRNEQSELQAAAGIPSTIIINKIREEFALWMLARKQAQRRQG